MLFRHRSFKAERFFFSSLTEEFLTRHRADTDSSFTALLWKRGAESSSRAKAFAAVCVQLELCFKKVSMRVPADTHTAPRRTFPSSCASNDYPKATLQPGTPQTHSAALSKTAAPENRPPATHAALTPARPPAGTHRQCQPKRSHCAPLAALRAGCSGPQERAAPRAAAAAGTDPHAVPAAAQRCAHSSRSHLGALFATASLEAQLLKRQLPACPELSLKARPRRKARRCGRGAARGPSVARQARTFPRGFHEPRSSTEAAVPPGSPCPAPPPPAARRDALRTPAPPHPRAAGSARPEAAAAPSLPQRLPGGPSRSRRRLPPAARGASGPSSPPAPRAGQRPGPGAAAGRSGTSPAPREGLPRRRASPG